MTLGTVMPAPADGDQIWMTYSGDSKHITIYYE